MSDSRPIPPQVAAAVAECIATAQSRCEALRRASQAYHALELLVATAMRTQAPELSTHKSEFAALLTMVRDESGRRLDEALEAMEWLEEAKEIELARRRACGGDGG